jgi:hypothetical protein
MVRSFPMKYYRLLLTLGLIAAFAAPAPAGLFFGKHAKPNPAERVPQLLGTLKTDPDAGKRASAAKELRAYDPTAFPELVPTLIDVLKHDPKAEVRVEVVQTLGKLRPISQEAGRALEEAVNDSSWHVRWQARQTLLGYRISGYRSSSQPEEASRPAGKPDPSAPPAPPAKRSLVLPGLKTRPSLTPNETPPPPLADPLPPAPTPKGLTTPVPAETPKLQIPPPSPSEAGPDLPLQN